MTGGPNVEPQIYRGYKLDPREENSKWVVYIVEAGARSSLHAEVEEAFKEARLWVDDLRSGVRR
jgi:hypothetical protein